MSAIFAAMLPPRRSRHVAADRRRCRRRHAVDVLPFFDDVAARSDAAPRARASIMMLLLPLAATACRFAPSRAGAFAATHKRADELMRRHAVCLRMRRCQPRLRQQDVLMFAEPRRHAPPLIICRCDAATPLPLAPIELFHFFALTMIFTRHVA